MDGGSNSSGGTKRPSRAANGGKKLMFRDVDVKLRARLEAYRVARGLSMADALRELVDKGMKADEASEAAEIVEPENLVRQVNALLDDLSRRLPAKKDYSKAVLITVLECVMLLRQIASPQKDAVQKAKQNTKEAYDQLLKDGVV